MPCPRARPAVTDLPGTCRRMALLWGVIPILEETTGLHQPNVLARHLARELDLAAPAGTCY